MRTTLAIIIPTLNEENNIRAVLEAVLAGTLPPDELVVVDGGSTDATCKIAGEYPVRILHNPQVHAAAARNLGIQVTRSEILAFTDADCIPMRGWLERIRNRFAQDPDLVGMGGSLLPHAEINSIESFSANVFIHEVMRFSDEPQVHEYPGIRNGIITANAAYRREPLIICGGFRDQFANYGEDLDLMWRMVGRYKLIYDPELLVQHEFPSTLQSLSRKYIQYGIASSLLSSYFLRSPHLDWTIYSKLFQNLVRLALPKHDSRRLALLYTVQLTSHLIGKWLGSVRYGVVNL